MNEQISQRLSQLKDDILTATDEVSAALEGTDRAVQLSVGSQVEGLARRYAAVLAELSAEHREPVERDIGRKLTDLRRAAALLVQRPAGVKATKAADAGREAFVMQRAPGRSLAVERHAPRRDGPRYSVGGEVEAWCGKCKELRTHHIVAMVDGEPRQVICAHCKSRHGYRTEPSARSAAPEKAAATTTKRSVAAASAQASQQRQKLQEELLGAVDPPPFDPRGVFRSGQIIDHPRYGRGKIENVLKGSVLVRFLDGLRPLSRS